MKEILEFSGASNKINLPQQASSSSYHILPNSDGPAVCQNRSNHFGRA